MSVSHVNKREMKAANWKMAERRLGKYLQYKLNKVFFFHGVPLV